MKTYFPVIKSLSDLIDVALRSHFIKASIWCKFQINLFQVSFQFLNHLKRSETLWFFGFSAGVEKEYWLEMSQLYIRVWISKTRSV